MNKSQLVKNQSGEMIFVNPLDHIGKEIIVSGIYDKCSVDFIVELIKQIEDPNVIDVGANIGNHLIPILKYAKKAIAFEPQTKVANMLLHSVKENNFTNCTVENYGLGTRDEELTLYENVGGNNGNSSFIKENVSGENIKTLGLIKNGDIALNNLNINKLDFIKIDVEGFEFKVIDGLSSHIKKHAPMILLEWNSQSTKQEFLDNSVFDNVLSGYEVLSLVQNYSGYWYSRLFFKLIAFFNKDNPRFKYWKLSSFEFHKNYSNILLYKSEHKKILNNLQ